MKDITNEQAIKEFKYKQSRLIKSLSEDEYALYQKAIDALEQTKPSGTYECFHCLQKTVVWDSDFDYSDFGYEGEGVVHICHCANCGAEIEYRVPMGDTE